MSDRQSNGQFAKGHPGGPGRPRRRIEREYLASLSDAVSPEDWREIVARAKDDAKGGDRHAREWLSKYLVGEKPGSLLDLAAKERLGESAEDDVQGTADSLEENRLLHASIRRAFG